MAAVLVVFLSAMVIAYALVGLATVNVWRPVSHGKAHEEGHPERVVPGVVGRTRKRRCSEAVHQPPVSGRVRCLRRR